MGVAVQKYVSPPMPKNAFRCWTENTSFTLPLKTQTAKTILQRNFSSTDSSEHNVR